MSNVVDIVDDVAEITADTCIGVKAGTRGFQMRINPISDATKACKVNVLTKPAVGKPQPVFRFDAAHSLSNAANPGAHVPHVNINPKVNTRLSVDPHLPIPAGTTGLKVFSYSYSMKKKNHSVNFFSGCSKNSKSYANCQQSASAYCHCHGCGSRWNCYS